MLTQEQRDRMAQSESDYKEWFDKHLSKVESTSMGDRNSLLFHIPKPFRAKKWIAINVALLILGIAGSLSFEFAYQALNCWHFRWVSNALLNISMGLGASLFIILLTRRRDNNIAFYTNLLPILRERKKSMYDAYFEYCFKLQRWQNDIVKFDEAWRANFNTCLTILNFFEVILSGFPYMPKALNGIDNEMIRAHINELLETDNKYTRIRNQNSVDKQLMDECYYAAGIGSSLLRVLDDLIKELECDLYSMRYKKRKRIEREY